MILLNVTGAAAALKTEFHPVLYVSGHYTDNADHTATDKDEKFTTTYGSALTLKFIQPNGEMALTYAPEYVDREKDDTAGDTLEHNASLEAQYQPSPRVAMDLSLAYDGHDSDVDDESWEHTGSFTTAVDLSATTRATVGGSYRNAFERRQVSGNYREHTDYGGSVAVSHRFGYKNQLSLSMNYTDVDYEAPVTDDYTSWSPAASLSWWINPCWGVELTTAYEDTDYDLLDRQVDTVTGEVRLVYCFVPHFKTYTGYKYIHSDREIDTVKTHVPTIGFMWDVTEKTGVSLGLGYLYQTWDDDDDGRLFVDADIFKTVDFSRHAALTLTAQSTIDAVSDDAADLGFQVTYRAGALFTWQMMEQLALNLHGGWTRDAFTDAALDRIDNTLDAGTGISWSPQSWTTILLDYTYEDFRTDTAVRENYQEHRGTVTVQLHPRFGWTDWTGSEEEESPDRDAVENLIWGRTATTN